MVIRESEKIQRNATEVTNEKSLFTLFFLKHDNHQGVEVKEVEKVDFREVKGRLKQGESVFIAPKHEQEKNASLVASKDAAKPWYFTHA